MFDLETMFPETPRLQKWGTQARVPVPVTPTQAAISSLRLGSPARPRGPGPARPLLHLPKLSLGICRQHEPSVDPMTRQSTVRHMEEVSQTRAPRVPGKARRP